MEKKKNETLHWLDLNATQSPWSVIRCPHCGYRIKLRCVCDVRDGGKCDWNSDTGKCKNDKNGRTTETAEPQPDGIQFRTVDDLGRICIPKDIRDKLGIKPGTECAVYATDELMPEEIIVIMRNYSRGDTRPLMKRQRHGTGGIYESKLD